MWSLVSIEQQSPRRPCDIYIGRQSVTYNSFELQIKFKTSIFHLHIEYNTLHVDLNMKVWILRIQVKTIILCWLKIGTLSERQDKDKVSFKRGPNVY